MWVDSHEGNTFPHRVSVLALELSQEICQNCFTLDFHTFTMSNIAMKAVVSFSPGLHSDRFEATGSVMLLLVFLPMRLYGHMETPPEMLLSSPVCRLLAGRMFPSWCTIENRCQIVTWHQTSEWNACIQNWEVSLWEIGFSGIIWHFS